MDNHPAVLHYLRYQVDSPHSILLLVIGLHLSHLLGQLYQLNRRLSQAASLVVSLLASRACLPGPLPSHPVNPLLNPLPCLL